MFSLSVCSSTGTLARIGAAICATEMPNGFANIEARSEIGSRLAGVIEVSATVLVVALSRAAARAFDAARSLASSASV